MRGQDMNRTGQIDSARGSYSNDCRGVRDIRVRLGVDCPIIVLFESNLSFGCGFLSAFGHLVAHRGNSGGFFL